MTGQSPDVLSRHAPDGTYEWVSPAVRRVLGRRASDLVGRAPVELVHPDDRAGLPELPAAFLGAGDADLRHTARMGHADGRWLWIETILRAIRDPAGGEIVRLAGAGRDVTAAIAATDALRHSNADLSRFAAMAAHDLREPLLLMGGYADVLGEEAAERLVDSDRRRLDVIARNAALLQARVDAVLAHAALERGGAAREEVDMAALLDEAVALLEAPIIATGAVVRRGPLARVRGDAALLGALLQNLLHDALKFSPERAPVVDVTCEPADGGWLLAVADNGVGIPPGRLDQIFGMFERGTDFAGLGVGLATAQRIAELHGGTIAVRSQVGAGSTFVVTLAAPG